MEAVVGVGVDGEGDGEVGRSWPMSDSATLVCTSMALRSSAMVKMVGAESEAATVWPSETSREMTTPSIGETIVA